MDSSRWLDAASAVDRGKLSMHTDLHMNRYRLVTAFRIRGYEGDPQLKLVARRTSADGLFILPQGHAVHDAGSHVKAETASSKPAELLGGDVTRGTNNSSGARYEFMLYHLQTL